MQLRLVAQHSVQQRTVDFDVPVVADQAKLSELVHELTDARSGGANHPRQGFLADIRGDRLRLALPCRRAAAARARRAPGRACAAATPAPRRRRARSP